MEIIAKSKNIFIAIHKNYLLIFILLCFLVLNFLTFRDYGKTWDEDETILLGNKALDYYLSLGKDNSYFTFFNQDTFYLTRGPIIEFIRALITRFAHAYSIGAYHFILALFSLSAYYFLYKIIQLLTKNDKISLASIFFLFLMPRFYGNVFNDSKDIAPVYILLGIIFFSTKYFLGERRIIYLIFLGIFFGTLINLKIIFLYVYFLFLIFSTLFFILKKKKSLIVFILNQIIILLFFSITLYITQPYLHYVQPFLGIKSMVLASERFPQVMPVLFEGKIYSSANLPWYYLPKWILISTPFITLLFFVIGHINFLIQIFRKGISNYSNLSFFYALAILWTPIILVIYRKPIIYDSWRHFLFLSGPIIIFAVFGFYSLIKNRLFFSYIAIFLFLTNIVIVSKEMIVLHPYEYLYFNSLTGGLKGAYEKYETDYWGASFKEATEWIYKNKKAFASSDGNVYIYPCLPHLVTPYLKTGLMIDEKKASIDYFFTRNHPLCKKYEGKVIHIIEREKIPLNIISKRR